MSYDASVKRLHKMHTLSGEVREEIVHSGLTYRGVAPFGALESEARWHIEREYLDSDGVTKIDHARTEGSPPNYFGNIWDDRDNGLMFGAIPRADNFCLLMDGINDYIQLGDNLSKERTDAFSWSFWYRPRIVTTVQTLYSKRNASSHGIEIKVLANGRLDFTLFGVTGSQSLRMQTTTSILPETWQHIVFTYGGLSTPASVLLYINSLPIALATITNTPLASSIVVTTSAFIGQFNSTQFADGYMNEVSLWNAVLSQAHVTELWNHGSPMNPNNHSLVANLQFDMSMGDEDGDSYPTLIDSVGAINGTMVNMTAAAIVEVP